MAMQPVQSSNVAAVGLNEAGELVVEFRSGAVYEYPGHGQTTLDDLLTAASPGQYVSRWLRGAAARRVS